MKNIKVEICLDSVESAIEAELGGADRVELCANLLEGGTTPSYGTIKLTRESIKIGLQVLIRPRGGDFCYSQSEISVIKNDILMCKKIGVDGVVIGVLNPDGTINKEIIRELITLARPMNVTFHRAFDMTKNPEEALKTLIELGVNRVLTSGTKKSVYEGLDLIAKLHKESENKIIIMPGCGITTENFSEIIKKSQVKEIHVVANRLVNSKMRYRNLDCFMGDFAKEYQWEMTSAKEVEKFVNEKK